MQYKGKIVDAHMHLWDYQSGNYPWLDSDLPGADKMLGNYSKLRTNYLVNNYLADIGNLGIESSIHIQVFGYPENPVLETKWLSKQIEQFKIPEKIIGYVDLRSETVNEQLEAHLEYKAFCGIRNVLCYHKDKDLCMIDNDDIFYDKKWLSGFSVLANNGLTFDTQIFDTQIPKLINVIKKFPDTKFIINHLAWPTDFSLEGFKSWKNNINMLKPFNNVYIKISALGCVFKKLEKSLINPYIFEIFEVFGMDRCCIGSNFPVDGLFFTFKELYMFYDSLLLGLAFSDKEKLFYKNSHFFYSID